MSGSHNSLHNILMEIIVNTKYFFSRTVCVTDTVMYKRNFDCLKKSPDFQYGIFQHKTTGSDNKNEQPITESDSSMIKLISTSRSIENLKLHCITKVLMRKKDKVLVIMMLARRRLN